MSSENEIKSKPGKKAGAWLIGLVVVAVAIVLSVLLIKTAPKTKPEDQVRPPKTVEVLNISGKDHAVKVTAYGTVISSRRVEIEPEVSGRIIKLHPSLIAGGRIAEGEELFSIDPLMARLTLKESEASVARAEAILKEAERRKQEGDRLSKQEIIPETELAALDSEFQRARADLLRLEAGVERTKEMLRRHTVVSPFNALVIDESVDMGQRVDPGFDAATLVGTDEFHVRVTLPIEKLKSIQLPGPGNNPPGAGAEVAFEIGDNEYVTYHGKVVKLLGDMSEMGRMARLLVSIQNPLPDSPEKGRVPLLLGSYVRVDIEAGMLENVLAIDRSHLREGNKLWIVDAGKQLQIRDVDVLWQQDETLLVSNVLKDNEQLVVSDLRVALPGMKVELETQ